MGSSSIIKAGAFLRRHVEVAAACGAGLPRGVPCHTSMEAQQALLDAAAAMCMCMRARVCVSYTHRPVVDHMAMQAPFPRPYVPGSNKCTHCGRPSPPPLPAGLHLSWSQCPPLSSTWIQGPHLCAHGAPSPLLRLRFSHRLRACTARCTCS